MLLGHRFLPNVPEELVKMGVDPTGKEDGGWCHADFYLSRPIEEAGTPIETLLVPETTRRKGMRGDRTRPVLRAGERRGEKDG